MKRDAKASEGKLTTAKEDKLASPVGSLYREYIGFLRG